MRLAPKVVTKIVGKDHGGDPAIEWGVDGLLRSANEVYADGLKDLTPEDILILLKEKNDAKE